MFTIRKIQKILEYILVQLPSTENKVEELLVDSRNLRKTSNVLFFAISGKNHDGHHFIEYLYEQGVRNFIVEKDLTKSLPNANILQVENSILALQKIAQAHREKFTYPLIALTGSNGKTIVKEWLFQVLKSDFQIVKSPKSYNSQVGVPLSLWKMKEHNLLALIEAGISQKDEMKKLQKIIQPSLGILTNIGTAHDEGFENREEKLKEKLILFKNSDVIFYRKIYENKYLQAFEDLKNIQKFSWGKEEGVTLKILEKTKNNEQNTFYRLSYQGNEFDFYFPFVDEVSLENAMHVLAVLLYMNIPIEETQQKIQKLQPISMRLTLKEGIKNSFLIDDSYNNDWGGLQWSLNFLKHQNQRNKKILILSDLLEEAVSAKELYKMIAQALKDFKIEGMIGIGEQLSDNQGFFKAFESYFFPSTNAFIKAFQKTDYQDFIANAVILVKGARSFTFEKVVHLLQKKTHRTVLEINLEALKHNLNFYRKQLKAESKIMVMVKAFAYGSGSNEVAQFLQYHRVDYLAVAYADEGVFLRENGIHLPIMVMNPRPETFADLIHYNIEPELYSFAILQSYVNFYKENPHIISGKTYKIHLKLDTGMHRLGFTKEELDDLLIFLAKELPYNIQVASVFSHLAGADESEHNQYSRNQIALFKEMSKKIEHILGYTFIKHILNSAGIIRFPEAHFDMVRLGIGLYGVEATQNQQDKLLPISRLKTIISQIKYLKEGQTIGYGRKGKINRASKIATIGIGYADGFSRALSNGVGEVLVNGKRAKVIGNICMDMTMIDITAIEAQEGDEVIIFDDEITILEMAQKLHTIPYEILTNVSERVKRVFYTE